MSNLTNGSLSNVDWRYTETQTFEHISEKDYRAVVSEFDGIVQNLRYLMIRYGTPYMFSFVVLGLIGNTLIVITVTKEKSFDSFFYRMLSLDAILSCLNLIGKSCTIFNE